MKGDKYSDDVILDALLSSPTFPAAAKKAGCSVTCLYRRLQRPEFRQQYEERRRALSVEMLEELQSARLASFRLLLDVLESDFEDTTVRLRAAALILQHTRHLEAENSGSDGGGKIDD